MNKQQKQVLQSQLNSEEKTIKELKQVYSQALKDVDEKIRQLSARADMNPDNLQSIIYQKNYQQAIKGQLEGVLENMHSESYATISDYLTRCYQDGYIGVMYDLQGQGIPLIMPIDQKAVTQAIQIDSKLSKSLYDRLGEDTNYLKRAIRAEVSRGIANGSTWNDVAAKLSKHMQNTPFNKAYNNSIRIARTEGHRVQTQSALDAQHKAKEKGADIVKQWDASLDGRTRPTHRQLDGQIREIDEPFEVAGMKADAPGMFDRASEDCNCRCALLQRARWALDEEDLETLKQRAEYFGLDKSKDFEDFKEKYLNISEEDIPQPKPKKEYLTEKKLNEKINQADADLIEMKNKYDSLGASDVSVDALFEMEKLKKQIDELEAQKDEWQHKLDKKIVAKEIKSISKEQANLQSELDILNDELSNKDIKTYSGIWKDDVTTSDYANKMGSIDAKKEYYENKILYETDVNEIKKWKAFIEQLNEFEKEGAEYYALQQNIKKTEQALKQNAKKLDYIKKNGVIPVQQDAFTQERKDAAYWFTEKNGGVKAADKVLRGTSGEVWINASKSEKDAIYEYTSSYHKFNEPLRGYEYGTNKFLGVGNVNLEDIGTNYGGYKKGQVKKLIDDMTNIIDKSSYQDDFWVQRGCGYGGMDKFFGIDSNDFYLPEEELAAKLLGTEPTEYGFFSTGVSKGKGFSNQPIIMNVYAPSGTKMMYVEPFSAFGNGDGRSWDGIKQQESFGQEAEMIFQRGTSFRVTKVEKSNNKIYIDLEVIGQEY